MMDENEFQQGAEHEEHAGADPNVNGLRQRRERDIRHMTECDTPAGYGEFTGTLYRCQGRR